MAIPEFIGVGPHRYDIAYDKDIGERGANGETYVNACRIAIHPGMPFSREQQTVLHEVLHAIWHNTDLAVTESGLQEHEEQVISALVPGLLAALQQNAELYDYLLPGESG